MGYVKSNALAGHEFESHEELAAHLATWTRQVADPRTHGTTGEPPSQRFERDERQALRSLDGRSTFTQFREASREVARDALVDFDTNRYSVPWRLVGERVTVFAEESVLQILHAGERVASHALSAGRFTVVRQPEHFAGIFRQRPRPATATAPMPEPTSELLRPLSEYQAAVGGTW